MDLPLDLPFSVNHCATTVLFLVTIFQGKNTVTAQFQNNFQNYHHQVPGNLGVLQQEPQRHSNEQFLQQSAAPGAALSPVNYVPNQHFVSTHQQNQHFDAHSPPTSVVNPHWNLNSGNQFYSSSNHVIPSWNQQQQLWNSMDLSSSGQGPSSGQNSFQAQHHDRFGILQHQNGGDETQIEQNPNSEFQHPELMEGSIDSNKLLSRRMQSSKNPHLTRLKMMAAHQARIRRQYHARLQAFYRRQQLEQEQLRSLQAFSNRGTYAGPGLLQYPQQPLLNPSQRLRMSQVRGLRKSQDFQRAYMAQHARAEMLNQYQVQQNFQDSQHYNYPNSIQAILQQQEQPQQHHHSQDPTNPNQNTLGGQYPPSLPVNPSFTQIDPHPHQEYSTIPVEENTALTQQFHHQPIRWEPPGGLVPQYRPAYRRRKYPTRSYPLGYQGHRTVGVRQSSLSLVSAGVRTVFSSLWEIMETLIGSISLFLYVVYSAVSVHLGWDLGWV